jgi:undecaprenyl-diphosphatase
MAEFRMLQGGCVDYLNAVILAVVEGITEFLPISSTGHMILVENYLPVGTSEGFAEAFMVLIQLPAILAVVLYFWKDLWPFGNKHGFNETILLWLRIGLAFAPAVVFGVLFDDYIEEKLFNPITVAIALVVGGVVLIVVERRKHTATIPTVHEIGWGTAFLIGLFQCLAMIPGTSRSAATIIGGLLLGASRPAAAEFSFFLAVPTMLGACVYTLLKHGLSFTPQEWGLVAVGSVVSFTVAYAVIAFLMRFIKRHTFIGFGWYRIALGLLVLLLFMG